MKSKNATMQRKHVFALKTIRETKIMRKTEVKFLHVKNFEKQKNCTKPVF